MLPTCSLYHTSPDIVKGLFLPSITPAKSRRSHGLRPVAASARKTTQPPGSAAARKAPSPPKVQPRAATSVTADGCATVRPLRTAGAAAPRPVRRWRYSAEPTPRPPVGGGAPQRHEGSEPEAPQPPKSTPPQKKVVDNPKKLCYSEDAPTRHGNSRTSKRANPKGLALFLFAHHSESAP